MVERPFIYFMLSTTISDVVGAASEATVTQMSTQQVNCEVHINPGLTLDSPLVRPQTLQAARQPQHLKELVL